MSIRVERVAEEIRAEVARFLLTDSRAEGMQMVTISSVDVTGDLSIAKVYYTVMGHSTSQSEAQKTLRKLAPLMRTALAKCLNLRRTPELRFQFDEMQAKADRVTKLLDSLNTNASSDENDGSED